MEAAVRAGADFTGLPDDIPALRELMARRQWVAWKYLERDGDITKPPVNPHNGYGASHSDPSTWGTYEQAAKWARDHGLPGVGYVISDDDDLTGADLDDCRDNDFGGIEPWANEIVKLAETYTEVSPSGRGLRLIWRGKVDKTIKCDPMHVEVYKHKRYLTITGNHIDGTPVEIRPAPKTEAALRLRVDTFKAPAPEAPPPIKSGIISTALMQVAGPSNSGSNFFREANSRALQNLSQWVPDLFGAMAEYQQGTGAWRVSSRHLGRNLQEDLSIAPNGIVDFGVHDMGDPRLGKRTPIDLALEYGTHRTATDAAQWLCQRMGIAPESIGWRTSEAAPSVAPSIIPTAIQAPQPGRFIFEKIGDLRNLPPVQWLVKDWIPEGSTGIFYGKWAAGKSFIGFDLMLHLAYGMTDWHGAELPGLPTDVLVIAREGHQGFVNRVDAFKKHHGLPDDESHLTFMRGSVSFMRDEDFAALCEAIKATGIAFKLILVDTVARVLPGVDMNEQQTVTLFMERIAVLGALTGASVIGVHHQNKTGGMMGSTFFEANSDFVFEVSRTGDEDMPLSSGEIVCTKMKDGEDRWKRSVQYQKVALSIAADGPSSLVVEKIERASGAATGLTWPDAYMCRRVLNFLREAWDSGQPLSNTKNTKGSGRYAPAVVAKHFEIKVQVAEMMVQQWLEVRPAVLVDEVVSARTKQRGLKVVGSIE